MTDDARKIVQCLQEAVDEELERKAKLGYKAVIADKNGKTKALSFLVGQAMKLCKGTLDPTKLRLFLEESLK